MNKAIENCSSIEELHTLWKEAHKNDSAEYLDGYENIPKDAFLRDGIISATDYYSSSKRTLFIGREAYCYYRPDKATLEQNRKYADDFGNRFWLRDAACGEKKSIFSRRMSILSNAIQNNDFQNVNKNIHGLKSIAFINLNKRGGYSRRVWSVLESYVQLYAEFIAKEIMLIDPDFIICIDQEVRYLFERYIMVHLKKAIEVKTVKYHPSYFAINDAEYLEKAFED